MTTVFGWEFHDISYLLEYLFNSISHSFPKNFENYVQIEVNCVVYRPKFYCIASSFIQE